VLSLLLYSFRPYKLVQQAIGDCVSGLQRDTCRQKRRSIRGYDYDEDYRQLLEKPGIDTCKTDLVRELLFKSRKHRKRIDACGAGAADDLSLISSIFRKDHDVAAGLTDAASFFDDAGLMQECSN